MARVCLALGILPIAAAIRVVDQSRRTDSCACLNWRQTYESGKASCGDGLETYTYSRTSGKHMVTFHFCEGASAYNQQNDAYCTKVAQGSLLPTKPKDFTEGAWCYVSPECASLNGGAAVNSNVSWKVCTAGQDKFLAELTPPELVELANKNQQDIGLLVQMAYPVSRTVVLKEAREVFYEKQPQTLSAADSAAVQTVVDSGRPTIFCDALPPPGNPDACGMGEVYVAVGTEVWRMDTTQCKIGTEGCPAFP
uniref:Uncharacterized protein n=1 Tax=Alexandrium andersonii TaxID=327968 RepID=A0A7S2IDD0_9DINO|mmetsp:Transcript_82169/g.183532  ORF Transcript_82169/g.183532 Transcript_82169/m.183532 type:complete len:252 (+) Transcript_82169:55-810(+)